MLGAALAVVHYKVGQLEEAQDLYARAYDIQVHRCQTSANCFIPSALCMPRPSNGALVVMQSNLYAR